MGNKNDRWSALSMKDRADLIKLYVSNGITSLDTIKKNYNSFAGGGNTNSEGAEEDVPTLDAYLQMKLQETRQMALANSYNATEPRLAKRYYTEENLKDLQADVRYAERVSNNYSKFAEETEKKLKNPFAPEHIFMFNPIYRSAYTDTGLNDEGEKLLKDLSDERYLASSYKKDIKGYQDRLDYVNEHGYDWTGFNCITNATGWYGDSYVCASNVDFKKDPSKYGFVEINPNDALPGDIFQYDVGERPNHATMYSKKGDDGTYYVNYSNGNYKEVIRHDAKSWGKGQRAFRFVGLPEDIEAWTQEYNEKYKNSKEGTNNHSGGGKLNLFGPGGPIETDKYGYPADITPAVVTQDAEFNKFLMTLPDNQRLTPEEDYHTYQYWKINGKPKDFSEALNLGMYHYDSSDNSYHANSVAFDSKGVGHFMKPKHHPTVKYELDWYNKGIGTLEGGEQYPLQGEERKEWEDFRSQYQLDSTGVDYKYVPRKPYNSFALGGDTEEEPFVEELSPSVVTDYSVLKQEAKDARDWMLDYYKSEGYKNRAREAGLTARFPLERHLGIFPKKKLRFEEDWSVDDSYNWLYPVIGLQESENPFTNNHADEVGFTTAHEFAHDSKLFNTPAKSYEDTYRSPYYNNSYKKLPKKYIEALEVRQLTDPHDMEFSESYSDLIGLRYLLDKYNIFDSKDSNSVFDSEMYNNLIQDERFKNNRFLKLHEEKQVIDAINNVAQNTTNSNRLDYVNPENIVAFGGKINSLRNGGDTLEKVDKIVEKAEPWVSGASLALLGVTAVAPETGVVTLPAMYIANSAGTLMDGYQAVRDFQNGDYTSGVWNGIEALAGAFGGKAATKLARTAGGRAIGKLKEQLVRERFNSSGDSIKRLMRKGLTYEQAAEKVMQNAVNYVDNSSKVKDVAKGIRDYYDKMFNNGADIVDTIFDVKDVGEGVYSGFKEEHPVEVYKRGGKLKIFT